MSVIVRVVTLAALPRCFAAQLLQMGIFLQRRGGWFVSGSATVSTVACRQIGDGVLGLCGDKGALFGSGTFHFIASPSHLQHATSSQLAWKKHAHPNVDSNLPPGFQCLLKGDGSHAHSHRAPSEHERSRKSHPTELNLTHLFVGILLWGILSARSFCQWCDQQHYQTGITDHVSSTMSEPRSSGAAVLKLICVPGRNG